MLPLAMSVVHILFLLSGATALAYQVTWVRNLTLIFGASHQATSIVLAAFMGGLCIGGFLFGRRSETLTRPIRTYALLEMAIAAYAFVLPSLLGAADAIYVDVARATDGVTPGLSALRLVMGGAILLPPTIMMGATLPVLMSGLVQRRRDFGARLSWLYGINTLGAVLGAVTTGFFLIPALGVWKTQLVAIGANLAIGIVAIAIDRRLGVVDGAETSKAEDDDVPAAPLLAHGPAERAAAHVAYRGAAVCGMCALALEVMWTRAVSISVGTTTYSFTVMLASFLTGIWLGSWIHAWRPPRRLSAANQLGLVMISIGVISIVVSYWIPRLPEIVVRMNVALFGMEPRVHDLTTLFSGFVVMLVPCIFMGMAFPMTGEARLGLGQAFGRSAGDTMGWNTLGSIAGSLLAGFVIIPTVGLQRGMLIASVAIIVYGGFVLAVPFLVRPGRGRLVAVGAAAVTFAVGAFVVTSTPAWDVRNLGGFQNNQLAFYVSGKGEVSTRDKLDDSVVLYYEEGLASTVSVVDMAGSFTLLVNGKAVATDTVGDLENQLMLGHAPLLSHPHPKSALVVGLGTGFTLASLTAHESLEKVTLVEIEPAVIGAQPHFAKANFDPFSDPRLHVELQDGRNFLKTTREKFDVVTADPIHPWNQGSGYLYTVEYYETVRERLTENGVMCQWLPIYGLSLENYKSIVASFVEVFPETTIWQMGIDSVLVGSKVPFSFDLDVLAQRLAEPRIHEQLRLIGNEEVHSFLGELAMDPQMSAEFARGGVINTDDNLYLEFASPLSIGNPESVSVRGVVNEYRDRALSESLFPSLSPADRLAMMRARQAKKETLAMYLTRWSPVEKVIRSRAILNAVPDYGPAEIVLGHNLMKVAQLQRRRGDAAASVSNLKEAVDLLPEYAPARAALGRALRLNGEFEEAIVQLERSLELRPERWRTLVELSRAQLGAQREGDAIASLEAALALNPHRAELREQLESLGGAPPDAPRS